jgi:hypothetical protein
MLKKGIAKVVTLGRARNRFLPRRERVILGGSELRVKIGNTENYMDFCVRPLT